MREQSSLCSILLAFERENTACYVCVFLILLSTWVANSTRLLFLGPSESCHAVIILCVLHQRGEQRELKINVPSIVFRDFLLRKELVVLYHCISCLKEKKAECPDFLAFRSFHFRCFDCTATRKYHLSSGNATDVARSNRRIFFFLYYMSIYLQYLRKALSCSQFVSIGSFSILKRVNTAAFNFILALWSF